MTDQLDPRPELRYAHLIGKIHTFEDGVKLAVIDVKMRSTGVFVTYESVYSQALPRRFTLEIDKFVGQFGHLFGINPPPQPVDMPFRKL